MKSFITNRDGNQICVVVQEAGTLGKLAVVMHGLSGSKDELHIRVMAEAFFENGYTVVTFDAVHTFGESKGGSYEDATVTNYYADLEDVVAWTKQQPWYAEPFTLAGHSFGGFCTAFYAENHTEKVKALAPISAMISGELSIKTKAYIDSIEAWQKSGMLVETRHGGKGEKRLKWSHMEDRLKYDLLPKANILTMPVLMIVGENDPSTPPEHQQLLFDKLPGKKELHVIKGAPHTFYIEHELKEVKQLLKDWITKI